MSWLRDDQEVALNDVVKSLNAASQRYLAAVETTDNDELKSWLQSAAYRRQRHAEEIVSKSKASAELPDEDGEFFRDVVIKLRAVVSKDSDAVVYADMIKNERTVETNIQTALEMELPGPVRGMLESLRYDIRQTIAALEPH